MSEMERYKQYMDSVQAPERLYTEVLNMAKEKKKMPARLWRRAVILAAAIVLALALSAAAVAATSSIFGWGNNLEIRMEESSGGIVSEGVLHTDDLSRPVIFEDGRMIFIVNGEHTDITELVSESEAYCYEYVDEGGIGHIFMVGKCGPELENYGFGEFLFDPEGEVLPTGNGEETATVTDWMGGYAIHVEPDENGRRPEWYEKAKAMYGIPWDG